MSKVNIAIAAAEALIETADVVKKVAVILEGVRTEIVLDALQRLSDAYYKDQYERDMSGWRGKEAAETVADSNAGIPTGPVN